MKINGLLQERWIDNSVDPNVGASTDNRGFENTRTALNFSGTVASDYGYDIRLDWGATANNPTVDWAYGTMDLGDGWELAIGNMKLPTNREWMINAEYQLGVERSFASQSNLAANAIAIAAAAAGAAATSDTGVYANSTGASLNYVGDEWRLWVMYGNGLGDAPGGLYSANDNSHTWAVRGEFMLDGADWGQFDQFTSVDGAASGCLIGVSFVRNNWGDNNATAPPPSPNVQNDSNSLITVDAQMQFGGSNLYVAYHHNNIDGATGTGGVALLGYGDPTSFEVQYGIYLDSDWELYARYQDIDWDATGIDNSDSFTVGVNYYLSGQNAKWSTDVSWADSGIAPGDNTTGWGVSAQTDDQTMIRTQLQFHF
jgi:hypothetical protein